MLIVSLIITLLEFLNLTFSLLIFPSSALTLSSSCQFTLELPTFQVALKVIQIAHLLRHSSHISDQAFFRSDYNHLLLVDKTSQISCQAFSDQIVAIYFHHLLCNELPPFISQLSELAQLKLRFEIERLTLLRRENGVPVENLLAIVLKSRQLYLPSGAIVSK